MICTTRRSLMLTLAFSACLLGGCGNSGQLQFFEKLRDAQAHNLELVESIVDADSAMEALPALEESMSLLGEMQFEAVKVKDKPSPPVTELKALQEVIKEIQNLSQIQEDENERLQELTTLPIEFWNAYRVRSNELLISLFEAQGGSAAAPNEFRKGIYELLRWFEEHGPEKLVELEFKNLPESLHLAAVDRVHDAAEGKSDVLLLYIPNSDNTCVIVVCPVDDFKALVNTIDFGEIKSENPSRRKVVVEVDRRKLGARANSDEEESKLSAADDEEWTEQIQQESKAIRQRVDQHFAELEEKRRVPQPGDKDYHKLLAKHLMDEHSDHYDHAVQTFLSIDKSEVKDADARKAIARGFREVAFEHHFKQAQGIRGLVRWGGKYSVPLLIELLEREKFAADDEIYTALAQVNDASCAEAVARKLGNFFSHEKAVRCLRKMGPIAEDALIEVAPSDNSDISFAAVSLLGNAGTEKSYDLLRQAIKSRNRNIKEAAKQSLKKIRLREKAKAE